MKINLIVFGVLWLLGWVYVKTVNSAFDEVTELLRGPAEAAIMNERRISVVERKVNELSSDMPEMQDSIKEILRRLEHAGIR